MKLKVETLKILLHNYVSVNRVWFIWTWQVRELWTLTTIKFLESVKIFSDKTISPFLN